MVGQHQRRWHADPDRRMPGIKAKKDQSKTLRRLVMMISGIGSSNYTMGQMAGMGSRPKPAEMFGQIDEDGSGGLDETEAQGIADMISKATGEEMAVDDLIAAYDEDGDGALDEEETLAALEANRPEGPPPGKEGVAGSQNASWAQSGGIENYMMMANLGLGEDQSASLSTLFGDDRALSSAGTLFAVNTRA
jgi:hypothetical protein